MYGLISLALFFAFYHVFISILYSILSLFKIFRDIVNMRCLNDVVQIRIRHDDPEAVQIAYLRHNVPHDVQIRDEDLSVDKKDVLGSGNTSRIYFLSRIS
jgi:hypothetical protein